MQKVSPSGQSSRNRETFLNGIYNDRTFQRESGGWRNEKCGAWTVYKLLRNSTFQLAAVVSAVQSRRPFELKRSRLHFDPDRLQLVSHVQSDLSRFDQVMLGRASAIIHAGSRLASKFLFASSVSVAKSDCCTKIASA